MANNRDSIKDNDLILPPISLNKGIRFWGSRHTHRVDEGWCAVITVGGGFEEVLPVGTHSLQKYDSRQDVRAIHVDLRLRNITIITTSEFTITSPYPVEIDLTLSLEYRVVDPQRVALEIQNPLVSLYDRVIQVVRDIIVYMNYEEFRTQGQKIAQLTTEKLRELNLPDLLGIEVSNVLVITIRGANAHAEQIQQEYKDLRSMFMNMHMATYENAADRSRLFMELVLSNSYIVRQLIQDGFLKPEDLQQLLAPPAQSTSEGSDLISRIVEAEQATTSSDNVMFSAYFPKEVQVKTKYGFYVYSHTPISLSSIEQDVQHLIESLGGEIGAPKIAKQIAQLKIQTPITIVLESEELDFHPLSQTAKWNGDWVRFDFEFEPHDALIDSSIFVRVSVQVAGIEIANIKCSIEVKKLQPQPDHKNPLAAAKLMAQTTDMYQCIFVSYSRADKEVVEAYRLAQQALGNEVFMDTYSIRTGQNWRAALAHAIDSADIFQLFWSKNSASSPNVRDEWDYALNHRCPETKCISFIRPVFWENPLPVNPPPELAHLNFRYVSLIKSAETGIERIPNPTLRMREELERLKKLADIETNICANTDEYDLPDGSFDFRINWIQSNEKAVTLRLHCSREYPKVAPITFIEIEEQNVEFQADVMKSWSIDNFLYEIVQQAKQTYS